MTAPLPPADLASRIPDFVDLPRGAVVERFYPNAFAPIHFDRSRQGRMNAPDGGYGVLYAAADLRGLKQIRDRLQRNQCGSIPEAHHPSGFFLRKKPLSRLNAKIRLLWFRSIPDLRESRARSAKNPGRGAGISQRWG